MLVLPLGVDPCGSPSAGSCTSRTRSRRCRPTCERFREGSLTYGAAMVPVWREAHHEVGGFIEGATRFGYDLVPTRRWPGPRPPGRSPTSSSTTSATRSSPACRMAEAGRRACSPCTARWSRRSTPTPTPRSCAGCARRSGRTCRSPRRSTSTATSRPQMAETANILVGYQTYPHVDQRERGLLAARAADTDGARARFAR